MFATHIDVFVCLCLFSRLVSRLSSRSPSNRSFSPHPAPWRHRSWRHRWRHQAARTGQLWRWL